MSQFSQNKHECTETLACWENALEWHQQQMTQHAVRLGQHQGKSWALGKAHMLLSHLSLSDSWCQSMLTGLHCAERSIPCWVSLLAQACAPFFPCAKEEALIDLAIVDLCSELPLYKKKSNCEAMHAKDLNPHLEENQQFRLWKSPLGATYRGSKEGPAVRRERRAVDLPFADHHDAWSLRSRQKARVTLSSVCST